MIYRIRAHHGMCFSFFQGKGYSGEFTENMWMMKEKLDKDPKVILLDAVDDVCAHCPNNQEGVCTSAGKADEYDRQVLKYCKLSSGTKIRWKDFAEKVQKLIINTGEREKICGNCQWNEICKS